MSIEKYNHSPKAGLPCRHDWSQSLCLALQLSLLFTSCGSQVYMVQMQPHVPTDWQSLRGPRASSQVRESKRSACFKSLLLIPSTPVGVRGGTNMAAGSLSWSDAGKGLLREMGQRRCQVGVCPVTCPSCCSQLFVLVPPHCLHLSSVITSLETGSLITPAEITVTPSPLLRILSLLWTELCPPNPCVEVLTPCTSECDCIWRQGL